MVWLEASRSIFSKIFHLLWIFPFWNSQINIKSDDFCHLKPYPQNNLKFSQQILQKKKSPNDSRIYYALFSHSFIIQARKEMCPSPSISCYFLLTLWFRIHPFIPHQKFSESHPKNPLYKYSTFPSKKAKTF